MPIAQKSDFVHAYINFQKTAASPFHAVTTVAAKLNAANFKSLPIDAPWQLKEGGYYYVTHQDGKSIIAFGINRTPPSERGFAMICAHTDSPTLRLRLNPWLEDDRCVRLTTQTHGGLIERSWFDRPLILTGAVYSLRRDAGKVVFDPSSGLPKVQTYLVQSSKPVAVIPDIAIHLDRLKNSQGPVNAETMLGAITGVGQPLAAIRKLFPHALGLAAETVIDGFELNLAPYWPHTTAGLDDSLIVGPRHDDIAMVYCATEAMVTAASAPASSPKTPVIAFFDAEETGSQTSSGAASAFMRDTLLRIATAHPAATAEQDLTALFPRSFIVSADMAHAFHPAYADKFDYNHRVMLNGGLVIKENAADRYATSGYSGTLFKGLCEAAGVPVQKYIHRQDMGCGSTIGPTLAASLSCHTVDVGLGMWAMHSSAETMGSVDLGYGVKAFTSFLLGAP